MRLRRTGLGVALAPALAAWHSPGNSPCAAPSTSSVSTSRTGGAPC